jgi:hypothetical protein
MSIEEIIWFSLLFDYKNDQNWTDNCGKNRTSLSPKIKHHNQENTDMFTGVDQNQVEDVQQTEQEI